MGIKMRKGIWLLFLTATSLVGGCGGGGGSSSSPGITPPPPPPPADNASIHDLKNNRTFTAISSATSASVDRASATTINGSASSRTLTISYNAAANSYTVTASGRSQTFTPADFDELNSDYETVYSKTDGSTYDYLTLPRTSSNGVATTKHVAMGFWQRSALSADQENILLQSFVYGFSTPSAAVPRTGSGAFKIEVLGLTATPGKEPAVLRGAGAFHTDFMAGLFSTTAYLTEWAFSSDGENPTGYSELTSAGKLSTTDGTFSGPVTYISSASQSAGTLSGQFFGPSADELGASFAASSSDGTAVSGAILGWKDSSVEAKSFSLTNIVNSTFLPVNGAVLELVSLNGDSKFDAYNWFTEGTATLNSNGDFTLNSAQTPDLGGAFTSASVVTTTNPNFTAYELISDGRSTRLELYKPGRQNSELQLTYASFGRWSGSQKNGAANYDDRIFFAYGFETPHILLSARTGKARYEGVVYGAGANAQTLERFEVSGTSQFDVDFSNQSYSGVLALNGTTGSRNKTDFGSYDFGGRLASSPYRMTSPLTQGGESLGEIKANFYGPDADEIAGSFHLTVTPGRPGGGTKISGITAAKR